MFKVSNIYHRNSLSEVTGCQSGCSSGGCGASGVCCALKPRDAGGTGLGLTSGKLGAHGSDGSSSTTNQARGIKQCIDF